MGDTFLRDMWLVLFGSLYAGVTAQVIFNIIVKILEGKINIREEISNRNTFGIIFLIILGILLLPGIPIVIITFLVGGVGLILWNLLKKLNSWGMKPIEDPEDDTTM